MKSNLKILVVFFCFSLSFFSCQKEPTPGQQRAINIAGADAAGAIEFMLSTAETPMWILCPECGAAGTAIAAAAASAAEASLSEPKIPILVNLPVELKLANNPQENIGVMHNKALDYSMNNIPKAELPKLMNESYSKVLTSIAADCILDNSVEKEMLVNNVTSFISENKEKLNSNFQRYFKHDEINEFQNLDLTSSLAKNVKSFCLEFNANFEKRKTNDIFNNIVYINSEIIKVIKNSDNQKLKTLKLTYLSVYKHSYYYWNNKS